MAKLAQAGAVLVLSVCGGMPVASAEDAPESSSLDALLAPAGDPDQSASPASAQRPADQAPVVDTIPVAEREVPEEVRESGPRSSNRLVEEIIVTAQKREERLQDVPISVQAFSQEKLEALGIQTIQQVQRATPGFTVTQSSGFNVTFLRGVGSDAFLPGVDSSVPFYLDGVPLMAIQASSDTLGRIERVEVLKGPQGTLFGRNATGGTVSVVTPDPDTQAFFGDFKYDLGLGRYGQQSSTLYVNVPIGESLAVAVSGFQGTRDPVITNVANPELPDLYTYGGRLKLRWDVSDDVVVSASGSFQQSSTDGGLFYQLLRPAPVIGATFPADPALDREVSLNTYTEAVNRSAIFSGTVDWFTDFADMKLIGSWQRAEVPELLADFDNTALPGAEARAGGGPTRQVYNQTTAELQLLSNQSSLGAEHFSWVAGLFFLQSDGGLIPVTFKVAANALGTLVPGVGSGLRDLLDGLLVSLGLPAVGTDGVELANSGGLDNTSYSAYAQGTWYMTETLDLTAGTRYQYEERDLVDTYTAYVAGDGRLIPLPVPFADTPTLKPSLLSGRVALQWRPFSDRSQLYASWARGYKNPTYNTVNLVGNVFGTMVPVKEERVDTYELGFKGDLFDGNLQLNAAGFYTIQKNPLSGRVSIITGGVVDYINAGEAEIKGVEFDFLLLPMPELNPGLVVTGGLAYIDARYTEFVNGRGYDDATGLAFGEGGATLPPRDLSGNRIPRVPELSWVAAINQRIDFDGGHALELGVDTSYASELFFLPQNSEFSKRDALQLYNARASWLYEPWALELTAYVSNITDEIYAETAFVSDFGSSLTVNNDPRMYGLRARVSF